MKERILETLDKLGFQLEKIETGYCFCYEGIQFLCMFNENDENFLNISIPGIFELKDNGPLIRCILPDKINTTVSYVKAYVQNGHIWLSYERELSDKEDLMQIIGKMIYQLEAAFIFAHKCIKEIQKMLEDNPDEEYNDNEDNE